MTYSTKQQNEKKTISLIRLIHKFCYSHTTLKIAKKLQTYRLICGRKVTVCESGRVLENVLVFHVQPQGPRK